MGVWLYPEGYSAPYKQDLKLYSLLMKGGELEIPPNGTAVTQGFHSFKEPVRIDSFQPHGHFRLVGKTLEIFYPETGEAGFDQLDLQLDQQMAYEPHL